MIKELLPEKELKCKYNSATVFLLPCTKVRKNSLADPLLHIVYNVIHAVHNIYQFCNYLFCIGEGESKWHICLILVHTFVIRTDMILLIQFPLLW